MNCQMIRVISSPSSSTTGSDHLDLAHALGSSVRPFAYPGQITLTSRYFAIRPPGEAVTGRLPAPCTQPHARGPATGCGHGFRTPRRRPRGHGACSAGSAATGVSRRCYRRRRRHTPRLKGQPVSTTPVKVAVTGAAGQIGYSLLFRIASGALLGPDTPVELRLLEITPALKALEGVVMELDDCAFPTLAGVEIGDDADRDLRRRQRGPAGRRPPAQQGHGARRPARGQRRDLHRPGQGAQRPRGRRHPDHGDRQPGQHQRADRDEQRPGHPARALLGPDPPGPQPRDRPAGRTRPASASTRSAR